jgi:hypothetical protein
MAGPIPCACTVLPDEGQDLIDQLGRVRDACPALRHVLLPDDTWPQFQVLIRKPANEARHGSIVVIAYQRGHLRRLTSAIHRYILEGNAPRAGLRRQYANDLRERWLLKRTALERHQRARSFMGKIVELQVVEWVETQCWRVLAMEAFRAGTDIEGEKDGRIRSFEVKYLGQEDNDFEALVESLRTGPQAYVVDVYAGINFMIFRVYEAAKQLQRAGVVGRTVAFVVNDLAWDRVDFPLRGAWVDWRAPAFLPYAGPGWVQFLDGQRERYPGIDADLAPAIRELDDLWILKLRDGFEYSLEYELPIAERP